MDPVNDDVDLEQQCQLKLLCSQNYDPSEYVHKTINQYQYIKFLPNTWTFMLPTLGHNQRKLAKLGKTKMVAKT